MEHMSNIFSTSFGINFAKLIRVWLALISLTLKSTAYFFEPPCIVLSVEIRWWTKELIHEVFSRTLQLHCNVWLLSWYVVCRLSVCRLKRECIVTRLLKLGSRGVHVQVAYSLIFYCGKFDGKFEGGPLKLGRGGFRLCDAISQKRCKIQLKWQLLIRSHPLSIAAKVDELEWPETSIHCSVVRVMLFMRLKSRGFRYKVALCISYLHIKLRYIYSQNLFLDTSTHLARRKQHLWDANNIFMQFVYGHIHIELKQ